MKKKILFISDWPDSFKNGVALQQLLDKKFSADYEWTIWTCKKETDSSVRYRWRCYFKGAMYAIRNRKKYDAIFIWQQMVAFILFELKRFMPIRMPPVVFFSFIYLDSETAFRRYKKPMVRRALKFSKGIIWDSEDALNAVKRDFPKYSLKNHYVPTPIFEVIDEVAVDKSLDDPAFKGGVYAAGATERDFNIVIRAFKDTDVPVTIVCKNDYTITEKDIPSNIRILRFSQVPHDQYYALANQAFCIVNSVVSEKSSGGILMLHYAMTKLKPVISTDCAGIKNLIVNGESGLLFNLGHEEEILRSYEKLKNDPLFTKSLIEKAKITANKIGSEGFMAEVLSIIEN
jgi:hypothetical protein